jgi:hypothetical protein
MSKTEATAEVFWTAYRALPQREQQAILQRLMQDDAVRRDLQDLATIEQRRREPVRPLREYLANARK